MIKRINFINNFGIYRDFVWGTDLEDFSKLNLIYGWNYSGKTTLSRIFQAVENKMLPTDFSKANFAIELEGNIQVHSSDLSNSPLVRVFNKDYIERNFSVEYLAPSFFIVGEKSIALRKRFEQLNKRKNIVKKYFSDCSAELDKTNKLLEKLGTNKARDISNFLGDRSFNRLKLKQRVEEIKHDLAKYRMTDDEIQEKLETLKSTEQLKELTKILDTFPDFTSLIEKTKSLLSQTASNRAIKRLKENNQLENWIREGLVFHKGKTICEFCGSPLSDKRLEELKGHFSEEYEKLVSDIKAFKKQIENINLNLDIHDEFRLLPEFRNAFIKIKEQLQDWISWANTLHNQIIEALDRKLIAIETTEDWGVDTSRIEKGKDFIKKLNEIIDDHNRAISNISVQKNEAKLALEYHYASLYYDEEKSILQEAGFDRINEKLNRINGILERVEKKIKFTESMIGSSSVAASKLNELLKFLLSGNNIVVNTNDKEFQFYRNNQIATHLSDGEKSVLTFAYFLTSLEANEASLKDVIVFIDDPVSSLDANHIYAIYALITNRLRMCKQLFVSTHNAELFNLLKSNWLNKRKGYQNTNNSKAYYVQRKTNNKGEPISEIINLPTLLRKFKSEYEFVFSELKRFADSDNPTIYEAYMSPNLLRKFLEAYLGFRKPSVPSWSEKLDLLFDLPEQRTEIQKFADDASHLQNMNRVFIYPEYLANAKKIVNMVLNAVKEKDKDHYESLCELLSDSSDKSSKLLEIMVK